MKRLGSEASLGTPSLLTLKWEYLLLSFFHDESEVTQLSDFSLPATAQRFPAHAADSVPTTSRNARGPLWRVSSPPVHY
jgi:hypothetical protein